MKSDELLHLVAKRVSYDKETGQVSWLKSDDAPAKWNARYAGRPAGTTYKGYIRVCLTIDGRHVMFRAHRIAFFVLHGRAPVGDIDHIDGDRSNNRPCNLREASRSENMRNAKAPVTNTSGVVGVTWDKSEGSWKAQANSKIGKRVHLGRFKSLADAERCVVEFRRANGYSARHGQNGSA